MSENQALRICSRRTFMQLSGAVLVAATTSSRADEAPRIAQGAESVRVQGTSYTWLYSRGEDAIRIEDSLGRTVVTGALQPAVVVSPLSRPTEHRSSPGKVAAVHADGNRVRIEYEGVNGSSRLMVSWRFEQDAHWLEPIQYSAAAEELAVGQSRMLRFTRHTWLRPELRKAEPSVRS
jgi:hypothetical protein